MAKGRQQYFADEVSIQKEAREFAIEEQLKEKIDSVEEGAQVNVIETVKVNGEALIPDEEKAVDVDVPLVEDNLYSVDTEAALSARQGKVLYDYIQNLQSRGRYLSNWNSATGLPTTNPSESPYPYRAGDYFLVSNVSTGTNYRPDGSQYEIGVASETVETDTVMVSDMYIYDGNIWQLIKNGERPIVIDDRMDIASTNPVENRVITQALRTKQDTILDLQTIREGAAAGATAVQPGDNLSTLSGDSDDIVEGSSHLFMTPQERTKLGNQTGVNTGDETQATIMAKLGAASATTNGYLTATDWNTFNDKQDAISDLQTIRENAQAGKNASDTIATYGDIVTHDVSEFATAAQGALAEQALQSGDNVSDLVNDAGYITAAYHDDTKQDALVAGDNITIGDVCIDISDMQGPCPEGYHVPLSTEWQAIIDAFTTFSMGGATEFSTYLKLPDDPQWDGPNRRWTMSGRYLCSNMRDWTSPFCLNCGTPWNELGVWTTQGGDGLHVRAFKNEAVIPDASWTVIYDGSSVAPGAGFFYNVAEGLISVSVDGTNRYTLMDKNLGATIVRNFGDTYSEDNCGGLFQWGNIHMFAYGEPTNTTTTEVSASGYGPGHYYNSDEFYRGRKRWSNTEVGNLRGGVSQGRVQRCDLTISATDTTYQASDFDIKDLADSTGLRTTWSGKQDALTLGSNLSWGSNGELNATDTTYTAGPGISISQNNVISNTQTSAEWGNITGTLSDQTDLQNALDEKQDKLTAGDNITIENVCESEMRGPCPSGFRTLTARYNGGDMTNFNGVASALGISVVDFVGYLKLPPAGKLDNGGNPVSADGRYYYYLGGNGVDNSNFYGDIGILGNPSNGQISGAHIYNSGGVIAKGEGHPVRPIKNTPVAPDNTWTTIYDGSSTTAGAGIFHNATLGLISFSSNGTTWYTIADKNLGATKVWNVGDAVDNENRGLMYQYGNNHGFSFETQTNTISAPVDVSAYGPSEYSSDRFAVGAPYNWASDNGNGAATNLWGDASAETVCGLVISAQVPDSAEWGNITGTLSNQTDLQNALDGKVNLGDNKVYDNTVVEIGKWVHGESADVSGHHITLDPNGEVSTYNVTVAGHNEATLGSGNLTLLENTALGGDETTVITQDGITVTEGQTTKTYDFLGNDRIATLSDISGSTGGLVDDTPYGSSWDGVTTIAPSKNVIYDKIEADLNTKTFYIRGDGSAEDLQRAQAAWDWILAGKNALLIDYDKRVYTLTQSTSSYAMFYCDRGGITYYNSNAMIDGSYYIRFSLSSGAVTSIGGGGGYSVNVLQTDVDYSTPYTPLYNGSPATKKYVDDAISGAGYTAGTGINIDANNEITNTLPGPTIAATAPTGTEGALWYDTTNDVLMAHDGTDWKEAGTQMKVLSYGHSTWQEFLDAYNENAIVYCRASSNSNPGTGNQGRMAFMAYININSSTGLPTEVEFQYYRSRSDHNSAANQLDQVFVYKLTSAGTWTVTERNTAAKAVAGTGISLTFGSGNMTIANTGVTSFNGNTGAITLTPGTYLSLNNNVIDVDTSLIATKADLANFAGFLVVAQLPTTDIKTNIIYLLGPVGTGADKYEEYIYSNNNWIMIGDTSIDLSPYFHKTNDDSDDIIEGSTNLFLTSAERTKLGNTSGTNSGDETKTTIQTKLGAASSSNSGYLTSTDYDTFNGKADASDVNTKLFRLSSNSDLTTAQAAYDWWAAGKNPIITHGDGGMMRTLYSASTTRLEFVAEGYYSNGAVTPNGNISEKGLYVTYINANSSGVVTSITAGEKDYIRYLNTNVDYPTPYVPQYDGSPATKKYVDDAVAGAGGYRPIFFAGSSLADIGAALANYLNTYSITPSNLSDVGPIGVWDDGPYYLQGTPTITADVQYRFTFQSPTTTTSTRNNSYSWTNHPLRRFAMDWDSTNSVWSYNSSDTSYVQVTSYNYLRTDTNYSTPYMPTYAGSPATKKYVDDTVAASVSSAITNETAGTTSSINKIWVGTEAEYQAIATYDEHTAYMTF